MIFSDFSGGLSDSKWRGVKSSFFKLVGLSIHDTPGTLVVNQKLTKQSGSVITAFCRVAVSVSTGDKIWFSYTDGKIWREDVNHTFTLVYTTAPAAGTAGCLGAKQFRGFLYWATQSRLHRIPATLAAMTTAANWTANAVPDWATFGITDTEFHPMIIVLSNKLYIGDGNRVAYVDNTDAFNTANALDINAPNRIKCMSSFNTDVILGTITAQSVNLCQVIRWDTAITPAAATYIEPVEENGVNCFLRSGEYLLAQCGTSGNWYVYNGQTLLPYKRIPGTWTPTQFGEVYPDSVGQFKGIPVFGFSNSPAAENTTGNPADQGIYTFGRYSNDYSRVMNGPEYIISQDDVTNVEIGAILVEGNNMYVAWKEGSNYGVDFVDYTAKYASAYLETMVMNLDPEFLSTLQKVFADYVSLPASTSLTLSYKKNHDAAYTALTSVDETNNFQVYSEENISGRAFQIKVAFGVSSNNAPQIEAIGVNAI